MYMKSRILLLTGVFLALTVAFLLYNRSDQVVTAEPEIYASPIQGGCYIADVNECRLHVDPFTINLTTGAKLVFFKLMTIESGTGLQTVIYDFRTDQSNPVPPSGTTYTPSLVSQDFAATCGHKYEISLQGQDTSNPATYNLRLTREFTCPSSAP